MKSITIKIRMDNAAFEYDPAFEVARILHEFADDLTEGFPANEYKLHDVNGNTCGSVKLTGF